MNMPDHGKPESHRSEGHAGESGDSGEGSSLSDALRTWFLGYALSFADAGGVLLPMKQLKLDHTLRTAGNARRIAEGEGWDALACAALEAAGLLHDVGRFPQYRDYRTFDDARSINHAQRGYEVLREEEPLAAWSPAVRTRIETAVRYHNARHIPDGLEPEALRLLHGVRDADKLDIIHVVDDAIRTDSLSLFPEMTLHVDLDGPLHDPILEALEARETIGYGEVRSLADFLGILLSWLYDLRFPASSRLAIQRELLARVGSHLPASPRLSAVLDAIQSHLEAATIREA